MIRIHIAAAGTGWRFVQAQRGHAEAAKPVEPISVTFAPLKPGSSPGAGGADKRDGVGVPRGPEGRRA